MKITDEFKNILKIHNELQSRIEKADELAVTDPIKFKKHKKTYQALLQEQAENFQRLYKIFTRSDLDYKVNSNKLLQISDFEVCRVL